MVLIKRNLYPELGAILDMARVLILSIVMITSFGCLEKESNQSRYYKRTAYLKHLYLGFCVIKTPSTWINVSKGNFKKGADGTSRGKIQIGPKEFIDYSIGSKAQDYSKDSNMRFNISYEQLSNYGVKIYQPKTLGDGYTGLYIDSVSTPSGKPTIRIAFYAKNLDSVMNMEFLNAIRSLELRIFEY